MSSVTLTEIATARDYIARVLALPEQDEHAFIGVHNTYQPKDWANKRAADPKAKLPFGAGAIASDVAAAVQQVENLKRNPTTRDIYVCMGLQRDYKVAENKRGQKYFRPDKHKSNILRLKSFFIDIDFKGGENGYDDQAQAEQALSDFCRQANLPPPNVVVHSGGGLHLYWVVTRPIVRDDWQPIATALVECTRALGLKCDTNVTGDPSRILRVPGTLNYKSKPERSVRVISWLPDDYDLSVIDNALAPYKGVVTSKVTSTPAVDVDMAAFRGVKPAITFSSTEEMTELGAGIVQGGPPIPLRQVIPECGFIKEALKTGGQDYDNYQWNLTTLLAVFTQEGEKAAHWMAKGHPEYNHEKTAELYERKVQERGRSTGWPRCSTIKNAGSKACLSCKHFSKNLYPFSFLTAPPQSTTPSGTPLSATQPAAGGLQATGVDILPHGYQRNLTGVIYRLETDGDGNTFEVNPTTAVLYDPFVTSYGQVCLHFTADTTPGVGGYAHKRITLPYRHLFPPYNEMVATLADAGVAIPDKRELGDFLVAWLEKIKGTTHHNQFAPFGWAIGPDPNSPIEGFSFNKTLYMPSGERIAGSGDLELAKQFTSRGELSEWVKAVKTITDTQRPGIDAIIASAFAGPLVYFTGEDGLYLNVYSDDSGVGKTTTMRAAQAVWGNPDTAMFGLRDTINSVQHKMGQVNNLTAYWDEIKGQKSMDQMAQMVFDLAQGKGRNRLTSQVTSREVSHWKTMLVVASNNTLAEAINELAKGNDAGYYRLFELKVNRPTVGVLSAPEASEVRMAINSNYGTAGAVYAKFLGENFARIVQDVQKVKAAFEKELNAIQPERYWLNVCVILWLGAFYANGLKLTNINLAALKSELFAAVNAQRQALVEDPLVTTGASAVNILMAYLVEMQQHTLRTNDIWSRPGRPPSGAIFPLNAADLQHKRGVHIQYGDASKLLRMSATQFHDWLVRKNIPRTPILKALKSEVGMSLLPRKSVCSGIDGMSTAYITVYDIDCGKAPDMAGYMESITTNATTGNVVPLRNKGTP